MRPDNWTTLAAPAVVGSRPQPPAALRVASGVFAVLLVVALLGYGAGYYVSIHRHYGTIAADTDYVFVDETTYAFFRPAIWMYERTTGREVVLNPLIHPVNA